MGHDGILDFLGINVLPVGTQEHGLLASTNEDVAALVHGAKVTRMEPSCLVNGFESLFLILVVAKHDVGAFGKDFTRDMLGVRRVNAQLHTWHSFAAGTFGEEMPVFVAEDGSALRHAVANGVGEVYLVEEVFHLLVEGCASDDAFVEVPSQCGIEFVADLPIAHLL